MHDEEKPCHLKASTLQKVCIFIAKDMQVLTLVQKNPIKGFGGGMLVRKNILMNTLFSFMVAEFMGDFRHNAENYADDPPRIVAHFHEWMAGVGLIMTR